jgi:NADH:ubiquinone oxidoreductase subunit 2 (subunit N)
MTLGLAALGQQNVKRLLAYSSRAGYTPMGSVVLSDVGLRCSSTSSRTT